LNHPAAGKFFSEETLMKEIMTLVTEKVEFEYVDEKVSTVHYGTFGLSKLWGK